MNTVRNKSRLWMTRLALASLVIGLLIGVPQAMAQTCCDKAMANGMQCTHPCCAEAYKAGQICFKCNPDKATTCCDKASVAGGACSHPCCAAAAAMYSVCFKCNPGGTAVPFRGTNLMAFTFKGDQSRSRWQVGMPSMSSANASMLEVKSTEADGAMVNQSSEDNKSIDCYTKAQFGDARIELEVMVPKGANSGIYVMGEYEVQVLDSYGKSNVGPGDMGGLYGASAPRVNASKAPGEWQKYVIDIKAPRFDANGNKTANAKFVKITLNDQVIHENVEMAGPTPSGVTGKEAAEGPLMIQGDHGSVAYRNIRITDMAGKF